MARFVEAPDLLEKVARLVTPQIDDVAARVERAAKRNAPPTKDWVSKRDDRVRETHVEADLKQRGIPDNLRFKLTSMRWDQVHRGLGEHTFMVEPRDLSSMAWVNAGQQEMETHGMENNCRCYVVRDPEGVAKLIGREQPIREGERITVKVVCEGHLVVQAEFGDRYPQFGLQAEGAHFMGAAAAQVAAELRARR